MVKQQKIFVIFAYDISSNRRRNKVAKLLETYGERVNYSVFELFIYAQQIDQLMEKLKKIIQNKADSIILYKLCRHCVDNRTDIGKPYNTDSNHSMIILK